MATATRPGPFARKSHESLQRDASGDSEHGLKRSVGVLDLTALGIGAVIGTGIFVIIGEAIGTAGPSIIISFALAGALCMLALAFFILRGRAPMLYACMFVVVSLLEL